ncbi:MAG: LOG family protein [Ignavibacteriales bacterium]|nr:LOG family protein [Ignavibacteriales bacterium]
MTITIFGNARCIPNSEEYETAFQLGKELAKNNFTICNGGYGGIMEASAKGAKESRGKTIGVVTSVFSREPNPFLDEIIVKTNLIERMMKLIELADAYIVLPGGTGTLLEFAAVWEFVHKQLMKEKPIVVLGNFWMPVIDLFKNSPAFFDDGTITKYICAPKTIEECLTILINSQTH